MYCAANDTFNVPNLTRFLNAEQESLCLEEEIVCQHMTTYFEECGKDLTHELHLTSMEVSKVI